MSKVEFQPLDLATRNRLKDALMGNAAKSDTIHMSKKDTSFVPDGEVTDEEVITAIRSIPCHY